MIIDGALQFTGALGAVNSDTPTTGTQTSTNVIDLSAGRDMGVGDDEAIELFIEVMTTFTGGTDLTVNLQGAPDNGSGAPGTYTTMWTSGVIVEADLVAGRYIANVAMPRTRLPSAIGPSAAQALPRFLRLQYVSTGTHGAGGLYASLVLDRHDYVTYPAGINIVN
jgi:Bbp16